MATKTTTKKKATKKRASKKKVEPASRGLSASELKAEEAPETVRTLTASIEADGGAVLTSYREPFGGHWVVMAALPIEKVEPTPFQRDLSDTHVKKLAAVIERLEHFFDPIIVVRTEEGQYWTPNGHHRMAAVGRIGGKSITALVLPNVKLMYQILALNTEKAPNLKDKALEVIRMARMIAERDPQSESAFQLEFEEPALLTLGVCYEQNKRFAGSTYQSILKKVEDFLDDEMPEALKERERRAEKMIAVDKRVAEIVKKLKEKGFDSPYLKAFVVARTNPVRSSKGKSEFDETIDKMAEALDAFDTEKVNEDEISRSGGYSSD